MEQREFHRLDFSIPCRFEWEGAVSGGRLVDISLGGGCITDVDQIPPPGSTIKLQLTFDTEQIEIEACVIHKLWELGSQQPTAFLGVRFSGSEFERNRMLLPVFQRYLKMVRFASVRGKK